MGSIYTAPVSGPPMPAVARILSRYDRPQPAAFIAIAIDLLDTLGPDTEDMPDFGQVLMVCQARPTMPSLRQPIWRLGLMRNGTLCG